MAILEAAFANKQGQTPQDVERRRRMAAALIESGSGGRPPASALELAGRLAMTLTGQYQGAKADRDDATNRANANKSLADALLGSSETSGFTPSVASPSPSSGAPANIQAGSPESYRNAIASIESDGSGGYSAVGPTSPTLGRALGRYQVMEANIPQWSREALGREVSADEFLANPQLQDAIFDKKFGGYVQQYGPQGAAQAWFAGPGGVGKLDRKDSLGTSVSAYTDKFSRALGQPNQVASLDPSAGMQQPAQTASQAIQQQAPQLPPPVNVATPPSPPQTAAVTGQPPGVSSALLAQAAPQGDNRAKIAQLLSNPYTEEAGQQLLMQEVRRRQEASDPLRQLEIQKTQAEIEKLRNPDADFITGRDGSIFKVDKRAGTVEQVYGGKPDLPTNVQEYEYAKSQGYPGTFQEFQLESKKAGASQVNIDQKAEGAFDKTLAEKQAATFSAMADEGMNARGDLAVIGELDNLLKGQGGALTGLSAVAARYGIPVEGADDLQAANALINKLVPSQRTPGSGTMSDGDVALFRASLPNLWNQPGGNQKILNTMRGMAAYKQAQGEIADQVIAGEMTRQEARRALREIPNPLAEYRSIENKAEPAPAENPLPPTPSRIEDMPAPEGMDPNVWKFMPPEDRKLWQK